MEQRLGIVAILVEDRSSVPRVNSLVSDHERVVQARMGLPMRDKGVSLISLVVEGDTDEIGALTGRLGKLPGVKVKSVLTAYKEARDGREDDGELHRSGGNP